MRAAAAFRALGPIDLRALSRDSMLVWLCMLPLAFGGIFRIALPPLSGWLLERFAFDLAPYEMLVASYLLVMAPPLLVGAVTGFLLLDERDDQTLTALMVTPLSLGSYLLYRIGLPLAVGSSMAVIALWSSGLAAAPWPTLLPVLLLTSLEGPIVALLLASFADNKVQGFAAMKGLSALLAAPIFAWFLPLPTQLLAGVMPTYWPLRALWSASQADGLYWLSLALGLATHCAMLAWLVRRFSRVVRR